MFIGLLFQYNKIVTIAFRPLDSSLLLSTPSLFILKGCSCLLFTWRDHWCHRALQFGRLDKPYLWSKANRLGKLCCTQIEKSVKEQLISYHFESRAFPIIRLGLPVWKR
jgi:hypothetical protein